MEKHLSDCKPCVAFLDSPKSAVLQCRTYQSTCDITRAEKVRKAVLPTASA